MLPLRNVLALGICAFTAVAGEYVQTRPCKDDTGADGAWRSLSASIEQHGNYDNKLSLELHRESDNEDCRDAGSNFSATLRLDMLGRQSIYHESGSTSCYSWTSTLGSTGQYTVYSMPVNLGYLPPLSTFGIQYRIEAHDGPNIGCVQAEITPAISTSTSATLAWLPRAMFTFALLVGLMRGFEGRSHTFPDQTAISLSLPGVGDLLGYLQFVFLSASLSLQYPGFLQPFASKLSVFSLFTNGPLTRGFVYQGVSDGIYSINGTYGGTSGLEHMHQIVGTPNTVGTTWVNMIIAVIVVSAAAAVFLEAVTIFDRYFGRHGSRVQSAYTWRLAPKLLGILRVVLSYFALPLSAISFYQLSTAQQLPVYHTAFATILILSCMLAFYWLFRQLPFGTAGGLIHDTPKWYRKQTGRLDRAQNQAADRLTITIIIVLTFVRGAAIGGLQVYGAAQLAILGASELCFLVAIRWLKVYPFLSVGTATPVLRLIVISLMFCFVPGLLDNSAKSAVGYTIISLHGSFLLLAFFIPTIYHCARISWKFLPWSQQNALSASDPEQVAGIGKTESHLALTPLHRRNDQSESSSDGLYSSPPGTSDSSDSSRRPQDSHLSGDRYFRQPRHSSIRDSRLHSRRDTSSSIGYVISPDLSEKAHVDVGTAHCTNPSSSGSEDAWDDTQSLHLGPRWNDFTYREGDAFYTAPHTPVSATCSAIEEVATSSEPSPTLSKNSSQRLLNGAFSTLKASIGSLSSNRSGSKAKAFEVVRPSRPALSTASEEAAQGF